jgi:Phage derived protein Gp49-like (DUF891)
MRQIDDGPKPLIWRATSKADFAAFPSAVQREMGYALFLAQMGDRRMTMARTLKGFGSATVIEVRDSYQGNAYRAFHRALCRGGLCASRVSEKVDQRHRHSAAGTEADRKASERLGR